MLVFGEKQPPIRRRTWNTARLRATTGKGEAWAQAQLRIKKILRPPPDEETGRGGPLPSASGVIRLRYENFLATACTPSATDIKGVQDFAQKAAGAAPPPGSFGAGFTSPQLQYQPTELPIKTRKSAKGLTCRPESVSPSVTTESRYVKPGTHPVPGLTVEVPADICKKKGKDLTLPLYAKISEDISKLAGQAEEEHCADFGYAFEQTVGRWGAEVNKLAKANKSYGPAAGEEACRALVRKDLSKTLSQRLQDLASLAPKTDLRDQKGYHSFVLDWDAGVSVEDECTKVVVPVKKGPKLKVGEIPSKDIIK
ncbi:MAG: hypothetical protein ACOWWM_13505 [Desulfobacterales bacterium]